MWKTAGTIGAMICVAASIGTANAAPPRTGGGGGAPHPAAAPHPVAAPHFAAPHAVAPHFAAHAAPHFAAQRAAPNVVVRHVAPQVSHVTPHARTTPLASTAHVGAVTVAHNRGAAFQGLHASTVTHGTATTNAHGVLARNAGPTDPHSFAARRNLSGDPAFRPFVHHGYRHGFAGGYYGWVGPLFWPYAFGDFFYDALWPSDYGYYDPFWAYGYDDIYAGIFSPYDYEPYVQGPQAPARMAALTQGMKQACDNEAAEVTNWPIDQIQQVVAPNDRQKALLNDFSNAVVKASNDITTHCPASVAFTPVDRLGQMEVRLQGLIGAVNIIEPPLTTFYDSLNDEQKARFNDMGAALGATAANGAPTAPSPQAEKAANPQQSCNSEQVMAWPTAKIEQTLQPTDAQKRKLQMMQSAATQAADMIKAACPSELPATPPDRLAAIGKRLQAQLEAVQIVEAPLKDFYASLSDEQKARFNNMGQQIFAEK
jgi:hypothetical protein